MNKDGPAVAAILSSAIGCAVIGVATILAETSSQIKDALNWWNPVGPLTGKTGVGVLAWLVSWSLLHLLWAKKEIPFATGWKVAVVLIAMGLLGTFPPIFDLFSGH